MKLLMYANPLRKGYDGQGGRALRLEKDRGPSAAARRDLGSYCMGN